MEAEDDGPIPGSLPPDANTTSAATNNHDSEQTEDHQETAGVPATATDVALEQDA